MKRFLALSAGALAALTAFAGPAQAQADAARG